jgi:hypothetical protein
MTYKRVLLVFVVVAALAVAAGAGTAAGQSAPDCSQVSYVGDGTEENPYEVSNLDQLQCMASKDSDTRRFDDFVQVSDIDASETSSWNFGSGFKPVPVGASDFEGHFDGNGYNISGLTIDRPTENQVGLFGETEERVVDVTLNNVNVSGRSGVGALVGHGGYVAKSQATGSVDGRSDVGGLLGTSSGVVESYAEIDISGDENIGGLVGDNSGDIDQSYAKGDISGDEDIGGLVGDNSGDIDQSYAKGDIEGDEYVGGMIGDHRDGRLTQSFSASEVNGTAKVGGLIGNKRYGSTVTNSYWDVPASRQTQSNGGTGLGEITDIPPADEMTGISATENMIGFGETWKTVPGEYPVLAWQLEEPATFEVTIEATNSPVPASQPLSATATITNTGDKKGTKPVTAEVSGLGKNSRTVNLAEGESTTELFELPTTEGDIGGYTLEISTEDDTGSVGIEIQEGQLFTEPLPGFQLPPRNTGELDPNLIEDLDGDGDGTEVTPAVKVFGRLIRGNDLGLTSTQAAKLDWDEDNGDSVDIGDMVALFGEKIRAG